ncbi:MAG: tRNA pseudouridine(38-40) synthase TruA [Solobacterium sp.]|nr:tRNA pseudouridine(38-40) synthase TruA [Solobacterium sp.]
MKRYKCTVAYAGSRFAGWQTQKNNTSVQETIEEVLFSITGVPTKITGAGRTDAGVNAEGQVFHFDTDRVMTPYKWKGAMNAFLHPDIHIISVEEAEDTFHARYNVLSKQYDYRINLGEYDVLNRESVFQCPYKLNVEKMEEASRYFVGTHDFTSFNSTSLQEKPDQVRTVESIIFRREGDVLCISYTGRGFLRYMVRMMSGMLVEVGRGKIPPERIREILEERRKTTAVKNAPAEGLTLAKVNYYRVYAENDVLLVRDCLPEDEEYGKYDSGTCAVCRRNDTCVIALVTADTMILKDNTELSEEDMLCIREAQRRLSERK